MKTEYYAAVGGTATQAPVAGEGGLAEACLVDDAEPVKVSVDLVTAADCAAQARHSPLVEQVDDSVPMDR